MSTQQIGMGKGLPTHILFCLVLAACGSGSPHSSSTIPAGTPPSLSSTAPTLTLSVAPPSIAYNATAVISWSSTNSTACSSSPAGITTTSGTYTTPPLEVTTTYTVTCVGVGADGTASMSATIAVTGGSIANAAAACSAEPMRDGNVYYYCDCGAGAEAGCIAGNNANTGTTRAAPKRTIDNAAALFRSLAAGDTVALCKGGAFDSAGELSIGSNRCGPGVACNDLREYTPPPGGTAKPIINNAAGAVTLFNFVGNTGGVRLLNLKLQGDRGARGNQNHGFFFYRGAHDVTLCNIDMDAFDMAIYNESGTASDASTVNIKLTGSLITNTRAMAYLGGGMNDDISYNYWDGNGSSNTFDHTIYFSSVKELTNVRLIGNHVRGQYGSTCLGAPIVAHMAVDGLLVKDNIVDIAPSATTGGCWGIAFNNFTDAPEAIYHRNAIFSGNTIKNGGNLALTVTGCPDCVIENNLIVHETSMEASGIAIASGPARTQSGDDLNTRNKIRNNTIWFGPDANAGGTGIAVGVEGTGHVIVNNTVNYSATSTANNGPFKCYDYPLTPGSYTFVDNNHCNSAANYNWEARHGTLAAWRIAAPAFDTMSFTGDPKFKSARADFTPAAGSPLVAKGDATNASYSDITGKVRANRPAIGAFEP